MIETMNNCRGEYRIIRRDGAVVAFTQQKISRAMLRAFEAVSNPLPARPSTPAPSVASEGACSIASVGVAPGEGGDSGGDDDDDDGDGGDSDGPDVAYVPSLTNHEQSLDLRSPQFALAPPAPHPVFIGSIGTALSVIDHPRLFDNRVASRRRMVRVCGLPVAGGGAMTMAGGLPLLAKRLVNPK